jgi:hypothetical protein
MDTAPEVEEAVEAVESESDMPSLESGDDVAEETTDMPALEEPALGEGASDGEQDPQ